MNGQPALYNCNGEESNAKVTLLKDKLCIEITVNGSASQIFWYYHLIEKKENAVATYKYLNYPPQILHVQSAQFAEELDSHIQKAQKRPHSKSVATFLKVFIWLLLFLALGYFVLLPRLSAALANRFPITYEKSIGEQMFNSMKAGFTIDSQKTVYINEFYKQLRFPSKYLIKVTVVKSNITNAFAMPGGNIVVYDKLLHSMTSYEELAALLSHEFIHIEHRHTLRGLFRQLSNTIFISLLVGDVNTVSAVLINNANNLKTLSYSRRLETEADENGARLLTQRQISCNGFIQLFHILKKESGAQTAEWMSSHPDLNKRIQNIKANNHCAQTNFSTDAQLKTLFLKIKTSN